MIVVNLLYNKSEVNRIDKSFDTIMSLQGDLRQETSLINPIINIECALGDVAHANYMYIPSFKRYYFINNIRSLRKSLVEFTCHVDVLMSFKTYILKNTAIISSQENEWNLYLNDGSLRIYQNPMIMTKAFPSGFTTQEFVLAIAGK